MFKSSRTWLSEKEGFKISLSRVVEATSEVKFSISSLEVIFRFEGEYFPLIRKSLPLFAAQFLG